MRHSVVHIYIAQNKKSSAALQRAGKQARV